jgi:cytoskeletal protein RodZ
MAALDMRPPTSSANDFGSRMRHVREQRGISLRQVAQTTKLSVSALEALERNDVARLPGGLFSRAFVRSYAAEIGADPEETVREFLSQFPHESVTSGGPSAPTHGQSPARRVMARAMMIAATIAVVVLVILFLSLK